jgi:hypothetical protein
VPHLLGGACRQCGAVSSSRNSSSGVTRTTCQHLLVVSRGPTPTRCQRLASLGADG